VAGLTTIETLMQGTTGDDRRRLVMEHRRLLAAIDTRRGDYYVGFDDTPASLVADAGVVAKQAHDASLLIVGDGAAALCAALKQNGIDAEPAAASTTPDPAALAALALHRGIDYWRARNDREGLPRPLYLRPADVTLPGTAR
jgi:tRNA A37 threonylcarbamoyladenosine modification protein TsaB